MNLNESVIRESKNKTVFEKTLSSLGLPPNSDLLSGYFKDDPRNEDGVCHFLAKLESSLESDAETKLASVNNQSQEFDNAPDIFNLWKFTLLFKFLGDLELDTETEIPNPWAELDKYGIDLDACISLLRELNEAVEAQRINESLYGEGFCSIISLYLAAALTDEDVDDRVADLIYLVGENRPIQDVAISESICYGDYMSQGRRLLEDLTSVRLEVPEGLDHEEDAFLDNYDWSIAADEIVSNLG